MLIHYYYTLIEKPESSHRVTSLAEVDMENVDYKRQPNPHEISSRILQAGGTPCGVIRGGMFGLATNQLWMLSSWQESAVNPDPQDWLSGSDCEIKAQGSLLPTVRPNDAEILTEQGIYVIRWINIKSEDIAEYTSLCVDTWPAFEAASKARCFGVFRVKDFDNPARILMLTWYASLLEWENSRRLEPDDVSKWARRSEMELSHWAEAGRLA
ncbi:MAG: hypothetical protein ACI8P9_002444 [Parasphingorhabdus sp.]|jgi:hypothetical protein